MARPIAPGKAPSGQRGVAYLWMLLAVTLVGLGLGRVLDVHHNAMERQREAELLRIGEQYMQAIQSYYDASPGTRKEYPRRLEDLLLDNRRLDLKRHLRRLYNDPLMPQQSWAIIRTPAGEIIGIHSQHLRTPIKRTGFSPALSHFETARSYADWRFVVQTDIAPAS